MKKRQLIALACTMMLAGCNSQTNASSDEASESQTSQENAIVQESTTSEELATSEESTAPEEPATSEESTTSEEPALATNEELADAEQVTQVMDYEEMGTVEKSINLNGTEAYLLTDNPGSRVVIFTAENQQVYKTIFVKNTKRLKVIDLKENQLVVNQILN